MKKFFLALILFIPLLFAVLGIDCANINRYQMTKSKNENIEKTEKNISKDIKKNISETKLQMEQIDNEKQKHKNKNILVLGIDSRKDEIARADTIILLNMKEDKINLISIPRDSLVSIKGKGKAKINASYAYGGIELSVKTVEALLNTKIDNYVVFNFRAVQNGVNALGGFTVTIPKDIRISDPELKKRFILKKGSHTLNGIQTLEYLRYRRDGKGDIGRIHRQQQFIKDLQQSFLKLDNIPLIPRAYVAIHDDIKTDMGASDMASYFIHGYRLRDKFEYHTLEGHGKTINKVSYYVLYENSIKNIRNIIKWTVLYYTAALFLPICFS